MLTRIARLMMVIVVIFVAAIYLPEFYWKIFDKNIRTPQVYYSTLTQQFMLGHHDGEKYVMSDQSGREYSRDEFERTLPLIHYRQLTLNGEFPEKIQGREMVLEEIRLNNLMDRIKPYTLDSPQIDLYPLFESKSGRVNLEMPAEMFRIRERMEFIDAVSNRVNEELSAAFSDALIARGFTFPAQLICGNPSTRKPFDEGYFVVDGANQVFQIKMIQGEPFCVNTGIPANLDIRRIIIKEMNLREFYGTLITEDSRVFLISYDNYRLIELPLTSYKLDQTNLFWMGNIFYRTFSQINEGSIHTVVTDRNYQVIDEYRETWETNADRAAGKIAKILFPFTISLTDESSVYVDTYWEFSGLAGLIGMVLFLGLHILIVRFRKKRLIPANLLIVGATGLYGLIAVNIFKSIIED
ncbi:MAG: DUF4857 domain-containing protein [Candidatus Neomarinimicrobiota bacterium]